MQKFPGQGLNPCHDRDPSCCSDNMGSLTCCTTRELLPVTFFFFFFSFFFFFAWRPFPFSCQCMWIWAFVFRDCAAWLYRDLPTLSTADGHFYHSLSAPLLNRYSECYPPAISLCPCGDVSFRPVSGSKDVQFQSIARNWPRALWRDFMMCTGQKTGQESHTRGKGQHTY